MTELLNTVWAALLPHLPVLPVAIPLLAGAAIMLLGDTRRGPRATLSLISVALQLAAAVALLYLADGGFDLWPEGIAVYSVGGWEAPYGIVLVVDRLAALLVALSVVLALAALVYSRLRWDRTGVHYHPLFQFLLMGLSGAFLTGDLFNLFVFFEILLAASYGLVLHGSGAVRVKAGLHYIAINLTASFVFLIAAALVYGTVGTLNLADIAVRAATLEGRDQHLFNAAMALLGTVFLVKAAVWPLNFWLVPAYTAAAAPVAAMFSIMTKVGIYAILRITTLLGVDSPDPFGGEWLFYIGFFTIGYGLFGVLGAQQLERVAAFCIIVSAGVLLAAIGLGAPGLTAPLLFYLISSALATGAFFLLIGVTGRPRSYGAEILAVTHDAFGVEDPQDPRMPDEVIGIAMPGATAFLGISFLACVLLVAGVPPLSGFVAKFAMISAALSSAAVDQIPITVWLLTALLLASGLAGIVALSRIGMNTFWASQKSEVRLNVIEAGPVAALVLICVAMSIKTGAVMGYMDRAAQALHDPQRYIAAVLPSSALELLTEGEAP